MRLLLLCLLATLSPSAASDTKPPTVPRGLAVTEVTASSVSLRWQASSDFKGGSGVAGYEILRDGVRVGFTAGLTYTDVSVASATTYQYAVRARDNAGNVSVPSTPVSATTSGSACGEPPGTPTGLTPTSSSSSTVSLQWNPVTPPSGCAVTYNVYRDGTSIATGLLTTAYTATGLQPDTTYSFTVSATDSVDESGQSAPISAKTDAAGGELPGFPTRLFAPYIDMLLWPTPSLSSTAAQTGVRYFSPGFIVAGSGCQATWGRHYTMADNFLKDDIASLRAQGGNVVVSFGGAGGTELALACSTVETLQAQYQSVVDAYSLTRVDFDIEGNALSNTAANDRRAKAIAGLQATASAAGRTLTVQFTLPVMPSGLTQDGINLLGNAIINKVEISVVNVMAMDYGRSYDPNQMGTYAVEAMSNTIGQLKALYGAGKADEVVRAMVGVTPMIGLNDVSPEVFTIDDAHTLVGAATANGIGFLSFWSAMRDQQCPRRQVVSPTCSGILQSPWEFTNEFKLFMELLAPREDEQVPPFVSGRGAQGRLAGTIQR